MTGPAHAGWSVEVSVADPAENAYADALVSLANGYQGIRSTADPSDPHSEPSFLVTDCYDDGLDVRRQIVNLPHPLGWRVRRGGEVLTGVNQVRRVLDLRRGICTVERTLTTHDGRTWRLVTEILLHATRPEIGLVSGRLEGPQDAQEISVELFWDNTTGNPYLGGRVPAVRTYHVVPERVSFDGGGLRADCVLTGSGARVSLRSAVECPQEVSRHPLTERSRWGEVITARPVDGLVTFSLLWTVGAGTLAAGRDRERLVEEHVAEWARRWDERDIVVEGDEESQHALRLCLYQLMQHELPARAVKLSPARGLSGAYHSGATFFDTELHKDAYWSWTDPAVARSHLMFRHGTLAAAREFARATGFAGARFPVAADDRGEDTGPHEVLSLGHGPRTPEWNVRQVLHISADVAYAVHRHHEVTGDDEFLFRPGLELLVETARFAASALRWCDDRQAYRARSVMGPDEYHHHVDDNLFTNVMLRWNLTTALDSLARASVLDGPRTDAVRRRLAVGEEELATWREIASRVWTPAPLPGGAAAQHDGYAELDDCPTRVDGGTPAPRLTDVERREVGRGLSLPTKLVKQADVVLLAHLLPEAFPDDTALASLNFYEPRTAHASSLSFAPHGVVAARAGEADRALHFFRRSARYNLDYRPRAHYRNGLHLSACAGAWQVVVEGFLGLRHAADGIVVRPCLPSGWTRLSVPLRYRGSDLVVTVDRTGTSVRLKAGPPVRVEICGEISVLTESSTSFHRTRSTED
jgi:trehalose/maltose hydrolase-like predicted phosphorylase